MLNDKAILVTGGTGSFGKKFTETVLTRYRPKKVIIFSRDEYKQSEMSKVFPPSKYPINFFLGDIRDRDRLYRAFDGVDVVVHAAALKQVPALEYNPFEAVHTNIIGAENIANAAIDKGVKRVVALSTDKAVNPINLYGSTKLSMEKIFIAAGSYAGARDTRFTVVRYGNVVGSRGSVIPFFLDLMDQGVKEMPVTDERMTRFWITLSQSVEMVIHAIGNCAGGDLFIPKIPSMRITDLVRAICPGCAWRVVGIRPGEKINESLISEDESRMTVDTGKYFVVLPQFQFSSLTQEAYKDYPRVKEGFIYRSDLNDWWLGEEDLRQLIKGREFE